MKKYRLTIQKVKCFEDLKFRVRNLEIPSSPVSGVSSAPFGRETLTTKNFRKPSGGIELESLDSHVCSFFSSMVKLSSAVGMTRYYFNIWRRFSWSQDRRSKRARR